MKNGSTSPSGLQRRIAAIDAGSNGIRLLISAIDEEGSIEPVLVYRAAVRLGQDAFSEGVFSERTIRSAVETFLLFEKMIEDHEVESIRAVATSATREAKNGDELVDAIAEACGIQVEVIDGLEEAQLVLAAVASAIDLSGKSALMIDMGGGSVEVTAARDGRAVSCETLPFGPVRLLGALRKKQLSEADVPALLERFGGAVEELVAASMGRQSPDVCIGTGGNLERLAKLRVSLLGKVKPGQVKIGDLELLIPRLLEISIDDRMSQLGMRPDRADLICIAAQTLHMIVDEARVSRVLVPGIGLKEGLILQVARRMGIRPRPVRTTNSVELPTTPIRT